MSGDLVAVERTLVSVVQAAACGVHRFIGCGDGHAADGAATAAMRRAFSRAPQHVRVVIGEGERDESPMLYRGELLGDPLGEPLDCAVDPCDGTSLVKRGLGGGISLAALSERGGLTGAPDTYMEKLAAPAAARGKVSLAQPIGERLRALSAALDKPLASLRIAVQNRPRHKTLVSEIENAGAQVVSFAEGDVTVALQCACMDGNYDAMMGIGAAPEGVITAAAFRCLGSLFEGRFVYDPEVVQSGLIGTCRLANREALLASGVEDPDAIRDAVSWAPGRLLSVALCGITTGPLVTGVQMDPVGRYTSHSLLTSLGSDQFREIVEVHSDLQT
jgi:fructose-1,6-bisphosphatase II / sedoheptulose-1,7-bisphosphatase